MIQILVDKALVMAEVQIRLRAVFRNIDLAMLVRAHRPGIDIDIRIELLRGDFQPARL